MPKSQLNQSFLASKQRLPPHLLLEIAARGVVAATINLSAFPGRCLHLLKLGPETARNCVLLRLSCVCAFLRLPENLPARETASCCVAPVRLAPAVSRLFVLLDNSH